MTDKNTAREWWKFIQLRASKEAFTAPNFLGVGAARCGTTTIYHFLEKHHQIYMSPRKEMGFFSRVGHGTKKNEMTFREYTMFFEGATDQKIIGEISPQYFNSKNAISNIKKYLDEPFILIQLRDPVERCISHFFKHQVTHKIQDPNEYFSIALKAHAARDQFYRWYHPYSNLKQSFYGEPVRQYTDSFSKVLVTSLDQLSRDPAQYIDELCKFLQIDAVDHTFRKINPSSETVNKNLLDKEIRTQLEILLYPPAREIEEKFGLSLLAV